MQYLHFGVLPGSSEALVRWSEKIKYLLTAYFLGNISAKSYENRFEYVTVRASHASGRFRRQCTVLGDGVETPQFCSSDISPQSLSPSQIHPAGMQRPVLVHWNWSSRHAAYSHHHNTHTLLTLLVKLRLSYPGSWAVCTSSVHAPLVCSTTKRQEHQNVGNPY